jgi:signal recognition particle GTPase
VEGGEVTEKRLAEIEHEMNFLLMEEDVPAGIARELLAALKEEMAKKDRIAEYVKEQPK